MKKRGIAFVLSLFLVVSSSFSQAAVIDVSAIAAAIENGITMYKQLQNSYLQYKNMIEQLKMIGKDMVMFDPRDYDWENWDAILKLTDHYMSQMDNIQNIIERKSMKIGDLRFSMKDLYTTDFYDRLDTELKDELDPSNISQSDKEKFYKKHGLSVAHFRKLQALNVTLHENAVRTAATVSIMESEDEKVLEQIKKFKEATGLTSGTVDNLQLSAKIQAQTLQEAKELSILVRNLSEMTVQENAIRQTEKEIEEAMTEEMEKAKDVPINDFYKQSGDEGSLRGPKKE